MTDTQQGARPYTLALALTEAREGAAVAISCTSRGHARRTLDALVHACHDAERVWLSSEYRRIDLTSGGCIRVYDDTQPPHAHANVRLTAHPEG